MVAKWDITDKCNLRCTHCSVSEMYFTKEVHRRLSHQERLDILDKLKDGGVTDLFLLGGEPLTLR